MNSLKNHIPLVFLCYHFGVSRSGYYRWKFRRSSPHQPPKEIICERIKSIFENSKGTYGSPRIYQELQVEGVQVSKNTVTKYMRELSLDARVKKKFRVVTTNSNHSGPIAERIFKTEEELRGLVFEYIETWYNMRRRHSALDYLSPIDYKIKLNIA